MSWTKEEMNAYIKLRKSLTSESRHRKSVSKSSSPPWSSAPLLDLDIDDRFQSQLDSIDKSIVCSDRILTCRIKSICSPAKGGTGCYRFNYQPGS